MTDMSRQYDLILYGATGYTGKYTAEYLQAHAPTDLNWAIAGRNAQKLQALLKELEGLNSDRKQPALEVLDHTLSELEKLAKKTKVLITTVGPYAIYGTPVVEACAKHGTHYLDVTGEVPWVHDMIDKYHSLAKQNNCALILQCGLDSVPSDIITYTLVRYIRNKYSEGVLSVLNSVQSIRGTLSGGTAASALNISTAYPVAYLLKTFAPFALSPVQPSADQLKGVPPKSLRSTLLGNWYVPELGVLISWPGTAVDRAIVHRSWGLFDEGKWYGSRFRFSALLRSRNALTGALQRLALVALQLLLLLPPGRWLLRKFLNKPGEGSSRDESKEFGARFKAVATSESGKRVTAGIELPNCVYYWTGVFVSEAALEILKGTGGKAVREGGVVTSACLEEGYVERLEKAGLSVAIHELPEAAKL